MKVGINEETYMLLKRLIPSDMDSIYDPVKTRDDTPVVTIRPEVMAFAILMERKLRKNDHKTTWKTKPIEALKRLMLLEVEEFKVSHEFFELDEARGECVDIANFAMILWDRLGIEGLKQ